MKILLDEKNIERTLRRVSHEIIERNEDLSQLVLVGIKSRGVPIAKRVQENITSFEGTKIPVIELDTRPFRDDEKKIDLHEFLFPVEVKDKIVILVDDVLYTGRTIRAAMDGVILKGRPAKIQVLALVDRGHRELPIKADYIGKNIPTSEKETIKVYLQEVDSKNEVVLF